MNNVYTKKLMKICLVSKEYPPETGFGGIGTYTYELAQGLTRLGHEVHVISRTLGEERSDLDRHVHVHRIKETLPWGFYQLKNIFPVEMFSYSVRVSRKIHELTEQYGIEMVEVPEWEAEGFWYSFFKKIPLIVKFHTPFFVVARMDQKKDTFKRNFIKWLERMASQRADFYGSPSRQMAEIISNEYGIDLAKIRVMPLPIDTDLFKPSVKGIQDERIVLYTGRLEMRKGVSILAEAIPLVMEKVPDVKFVFIGKNNFSAHYGMTLKDLILQKSGRPQQIIFYDHMDRNQLIEHYCRSSVCVIPSVWENFGYTVLEAMACGTPVITSDTVGITEYLDQSGVIKVPAENSGALAEAIIKILEDHELRQKSKTKVRFMAKNSFSREMVSVQYEGYYQGIIEEIGPKTGKGLPCLKVVRS